MYRKAGDAIIPYDPRHAGFKAEALNKLTGGPLGFQVGGGGHAIFGKTDYTYIILPYFNSLDL